MVHFPGFARTRLCIYRAVIRFCRIGFPHSEIPGSMPTCGSPRLIAACHVLHRLLLPRHPPCALSSLTIKFTQLTRRLRRRPSAISCQPSVPLPTVPNNFMTLICSSLPRLLRTMETPAVSKALIKLTLYSPCSYPMLFSCQKSSRLAASHLGGFELLPTQCSAPSDLPWENRYRIVRLSLLTPNVKLGTSCPRGLDPSRVRFSQSALDAEEPGPRPQSHRLQ
jgi:hypothetical protein